MFACLALRQTNDMGIHHPVSRSLGAALAWLQDPASPLGCSWSRPSSQGNGSNAAMKEGAPDVMANIVSTDIVTLVPFRRQRGKKRFLGLWSSTVDARRSCFIPKGSMRMEGGQLLCPALSRSPPPSSGLRPQGRHLLSGQLSLGRECLWKGDFLGQVSILVSWPWR